MATRLHNKVLRSAEEIVAMTVVKETRVSFVAGLVLLEYICATSTIKFLDAEPIYWHYATKSSSNDRYCYLRIS